MKEFTLERTGNLPLEFTGEVVAESTGRNLNGADRNRWHDITVYKTQGDNWVLHIEYRTIWQGESDWSMARYFYNAMNLMKILETYDPTSQVQGFPPGEAYADKQRRLISGIKRDFAVQLTDIFDQCGFSEHVD